MPKPGTDQDGAFSEKTDWQILMEDPLVATILPRLARTMQAQIATIREKGIDTSQLERAWVAELGWAKSQWRELGEGKAIAFYADKAKRITHEIDDFDPGTLSIGEQSRQAIDNLVAATVSAEAAASNLSSVVDTLRGIEFERDIIDFPPDVAEMMRERQKYIASLADDPILAAGQRMINQGLEDLRRMADFGTGVSRARNDLSAILRLSRIVRLGAKFFYGVVIFIVLFDFALDEVKQFARGLVGDNRWLQFLAIIAVLLILSLSLNGWSRGSITG